MGFAREFLPSLVESGDVTPDEARTIAADLARADADPNTLVITPGVLQIAARKPI
jgi:hypothetical protein